MTDPPRVVLAKVGLDGHDVGILLLAKRLSNAGFEVVFLGKRNRPADVARAAVDEDAQIVGVSALSGGAGALATKTVSALRALGSSVPVIFGGIAEASEVDAMVAAGVARCFGPDATIEQVARAFEELASLEDPAGSH